MRISYGKLRVPVHRIDGGDVLACEVDVEVLGENFAPAYTEGDNSMVVATDSIKNLVLRESGSWTGATPESLLLHLGGLMLADYPQMQGLRMAWEEIPFTSAGGDVLFARAGDDRAVADMRLEREGDGIRIADLNYPKELAEKLRTTLDYHNFVLTKYLGVEAVDFQKALDEALAFGAYVDPMKADVAGILHDLRKQGKRVMFEGAQGSLLDIDHGTYPYVTSSNTTVGGAMAGTGVGADAIDYVLGIAKAYATRVGGGPFPTELNDDIGQGIHDRGQEYGATTGRPRRCRWMDIVALKRAVAINGITGLCITKLDILDGMEKLKICIAYEYRGKRTEYAPLDAAGWEECTPVYLEFPGWNESTHGITEWDKLPAAARAYLRALEELAGCPLAIVSTGPDRDANIVLQDPFA